MEPHYSFGTSCQKLAYTDGAIKCPSRTITTWEVRCGLALIKPKIIQIQKKKYYEKEWQVFNDRISTIAADLDAVNKRIPHLQLTAYSPTSKTLTITNKFYQFQRSLKLGNPQIYIQFGSSPSTDIPSCKKSLHKQKLGKLLLANS